MTDILGDYVNGRERVLGRPGRLPFEPDALATALVEALGPIGARRHLEAAATEVRASLVPIEMVVDLADIGNRVDASDRETIDQAVAFLIGGDS